MNKEELEDFKKILGLSHKYYNSFIGIRSQYNRSFNRSLNNDLEIILEIAQKYKLSDIDLNNITEEIEGKQNKYYFVAYIKKINDVTWYCNDTIMEEPVNWIMNKATKDPSVYYNLVFFKEISIKQFKIFNPEYKVI